MRRKGKIQSVLLFLLLHVGYLWEYNYSIIKYFEYMMLAFFLIFIIYNIYVSSSTKRLQELVLVMLSIIALLCVNTYNTNNRLFKDPQLQNIVKNKYEFQFMTKEKLMEGDTRLERIMHLNISSKFGVKTLDGIENLPNLKNIDIYRQDKLIDYSNLSYLNNLENLYISSPHPDFSINHIPKLENLEFLMIYLWQHEFNDKIMDFSRFPNIKTIKLLGLRSQEPITIDIRSVQNIESIEIGLGVEKIIGLEEAVSLKKIDLYHESNDYKDEIKKLRPDIELR